MPGWGAACCVPPNFGESLASDVYGNGLAFAFAALREPCGKSRGKSFGSEAEAGFELAIGDWERVVEISGVGEVAHAKLIEPIERTGARLTANHYIDVKFLRVHEANGWGKLHTNI